MSNSVTNTKSLPNKRRVHVLQIHTDWALPNQLSVNTDNSRPWTTK